MRIYICVIIFFLVSAVSFSQKKSLKGQIIQYETKKALGSAYLLNLNSVVGTITDEKGEFELVAKANDTIFISYLGFSSIKLKVTNDLLKGNKLVIKLHEKPEEIKEVVINSTKLIGVLEVDIKSVPKDRFTRIHIDGLTQTYELGRRSSKSLSPSVFDIFKPLDFLYNLFGKKPKELKKLKKLKTQDDLRKMLMSKFDREIMMEYLKLDKQQLVELLSNCSYSKYFIKKASDLQIIEAILNCYENYNALKKGEIKLDESLGRKNKPI